MSRRWLESSLLGSKPIANSWKLLPSLSQRLRFWRWATKNCAASCTALRLIQEVANKTKLKAVVRALQYPAVTIAILLLWNKNSARLCSSTIVLEKGLKELTSLMIKLVTGQREFIINSELLPRTRLSSQSQLTLLALSKLSRWLFRKSWLKLSSADKKRVKLVVLNTTRYLTTLLQKTLWTKTSALDQLAA